MKKLIIYLTVDKTISIECEKFNVGASLELMVYNQGNELAACFFTYIGFVSI